MAFEAINNTMSQFEKVTLDEMSGVQLMNRIDNKYVIPAVHLPGILDRISDQYYALEIEGLRLMKYSTLYFDSPNLDFYNRHHNGLLNRYKVRQRKYEETDTSFFEVKFKNNKGVTQKSRIHIDEITHRLNEKQCDFLSEISPLNGNKLEPVLWVYYQRATLVSKAMNERLTIDVNLNFEFDGSECSMSHLVILEAKRDRALKVTPILSELRNLKILPSGFSKYCMGLASVRDDVKRNRFKPRFRKLEKLKVA